MSGTGSNGDKPENTEDAKAATGEPTEDDLAKVADSGEDTKEELTAEAGADDATTEDAATAEDADATIDDAAVEEPPSAPALDPDPTIAQPPPFEPVADPGAPARAASSMVIIHDEEAVDTSGIDADDADALHSVGMFLAGDADHVDIDQMELPPELEEPSFAQLARNWTSWVIFVLCIAVAIGGVLHIQNTEELRIQVELLFTGGLVRHKRADIIEAKERYQKEDTYAQNRYGQFKMIYSPRDATVEVTLIKYKENIGDFMTRYVKGVGDKRQPAEVRSLRKFKELTTGLKERQVVNEQNIKDLPVTSRTNPKDAEHPDRPKACTDSKEDYCSFVYRIKISKELYRPREFIVFSEYSLEPPDLVPCDTPDADQEKCYDAKKVQQLLFKNTGPGIYEVFWPGADLQPTPALFAQQFTRVMTDRIKCKLGPEDWKPLELKNGFRELMELPEDDRWQKLADNGLLSHGPPAAKVWTLMEWKASVAELREPENLELWTNAQQTIADCKCEEGVKCWQPAGGDAPAPAPAP